MLERKTATVRIVLVLTGVVLGCMALAAYVFPYLHHSEKPGSVFLLGHWFDLPWQLGAPLLIAALASVLLGVLLPCWRRSQ